MERSMKKIPVIVVVMVVFLAASVAGAASFTPAEMAKLDAGKTVKQPLPASRQNGFFGGTGWALIDAPADVIWAALEDWGSYSKMFPNTVSVTEVSRKGEKALVRMQQGHPLVNVSYFVEVVRDTAKQMVTFRMVGNKAHDIDDARGYWRLFPQKDGRTLVAYVVAVQFPAGLMVILGSGLEAKIERHLLGLPGNLKSWVEGPAASRYRTMTAKNN
ncbi:MAG: SRPBCC family protein [Deltaproteobacteria bacterium]|nr:SRPBCC family protein [Deltaproteobacteria bacterium]